MAADRAERTGALVVRAWVVQERDDAGLLARISYRADLTAPDDETVRVVASREQVLGTVAEWLDQLTR